MTFLPQFTLGGDPSPFAADPSSPEGVVWVQVFGGLVTTGVALWLLWIGLRPGGSLSLSGDSGITRQQPAKFWMLAAIHVFFALLGLALTIQGCVAVFLWMKR